MRTESFDKWTDQYCFSNGFEFMDWAARNCDVCVKASRYDENTDDYTSFLCSIQRQYIMQSAGIIGNVSHRTYNVCQMKDCPYRRTKPYPRRKIKKSITNNIKSLFDDENV